MKNFWNSRVFLPSLRFKSLFFFLVPTLLFVSFLNLFSYIRSRTLMDEELGKKLNAIGQTAQTHLSIEWILSFEEGDEASKTYKNYQEKLKKIVQSTGIKRIYIFDPQNKNLLDTELTAVGKTFAELTLEARELKLVWAGEARSSTLFQDKQGTYYKMGFVPLFHQKKVQAVLAVVGSAVFFVPLKESLRSLLLLSSFALFLMLVVSLLFSNILTHPIEKLVRSVQFISGGDLKKQVEVEGKDEMSFLAQTIEKMRCNILQRDEQMQMMLSGIAHEIRNPLAGMQLFADILKEECEEDKDKLPHVMRIRKEIIYLTEVVNHFLAYARPLELQKQLVTLESFFRELKTLLVADLAEKDITLCFDGELHSQISMDPNRMQQVFLNLIQNAIHASTVSGKIEINAFRDSKKWNLVIQDDGVGMEPDVLKKMGEPFYTTKEKGTGLGIPLAKKIIEQHYGTIDIKSQKNKGTQIILTFPL